MNGTSTQPDPNERAELARLLPGPVERDLPRDRHQRLQEFVMSRIHQDLRSAEQAPRRSPKRWPVFLASALTAVAVAAAVTFVAVGHDSGPAGAPPAPGSSSTPINGGRTMSTRQMLLAAATSAERRPATDGAYWRVRTLREVRVGKVDHKQILEDWYGKDGYYWQGTLTLDGTGGPSGPASIYRDKKKSSRPFELSDRRFTLAEIKGLPTTTRGIVKWASGVARHVSPDWRQYDIDGFTTDLLIQLLAEAPATPQTRAAAFRALAGRPFVKNAGRAKDEEGRTGYALRIDGTRYLIDPSTATLLSESTTADGKYGATTYLKAGWTNEAPNPPSGH
ncbi:CU044_5270 family protein [Actinoallomurus oryzae]|uniref:CU044_5270 family protein n=1 Tax=Actinoallomurus oryzae TaxID=502180 RepID=A0ABP8R110_9ACTN